MGRINRWTLMIPRFCAYGFLKNLRFFDVFLILFLRQKGLSFLEIGTLIGIREMTAMILEVPTGIVADLIGRRKAMITAFLSYIISFLFYYAARNFMWFLPAVILFGVGDALRSGTHKAMILEYLDLRGLSDKKVEVYGRTRSWSQIGSALSTVIAAVLVFYKGDYGIVFLASLIPYILDLGLMISYPKELDGKRSRHLSLRAVFDFTLHSFRNCWNVRPLRTALLNSSLDKGVYKVAKDYLQPVLKASSMALLPFMVRLFPGATEQQATAVAIGVVYSILYLANSQASRRAYVVQRWLGGSKRALNWTYFSLLLISSMAFLALRFDLRYLAVLAFLMLAFVENARRPMLVSYLGAFMERKQRATVLSVESQLSALTAMVMGPVMGFFADHFGISGVFIVSILLFTALGIPLRIKEED
ncbi:TPA: MFS transporter [Candidatus Poribacteria bacterium]|nr:MFS transporter [Candidatus Poribacteria bacterium]